MVDDPTKTGDAAANAGGAQDTPAGNEDGNQDSYFLEIDDRTRYKTQEDAVKGFREAGERISGLSAYEKIAQEYGIEDPDELPELLDELATLRTAKEAAGKTAEKPGATSADAKADAEIDASGLSEEDKQALKWAKRVGIVTNEDLTAKITELQGTIEKLQSGNKEAEEARLNERIEEGRAYVPALLKQNELPADDKRFVARVERHIRAYLEDMSFRNGKLVKGSPLDRFYRGGVSQQSALDEAFQDFMETYKFSASRKDTGYAAEKKSAQKGTPKTLPKGGIPGGQKEGESPTTFADAHKQAWDVYQQKLGHGQES